MIKSLTTSEDFRGLKSYRNGKNRRKALGRTKCHTDPMTISFQSFQVIVRFQYFKSLSDGTWLNLTLLIPSLKIYGEFGHGRVCRCLEHEGW